jgi:hypothetical protein
MWIVATYKKDPAETKSKIPTQNINLDELASISTPSNKK